MSRKEIYDTRLARPRLSGECQLNTNGSELCSVVSSLSPQPEPLPRLPRLHTSLLRPPVAKRRSHTRHRAAPMPANGRRQLNTEFDTVKLTVTGVCQEPTPGYKLTLTHVDLPGSDPATLTLVLSVVAPTGIEPQHVTPTPVEYQQTFVIPKDHVPVKVTIFEAAATVQVNAQ